MNEPNKQINHIPTEEFSKRFGVKPDTTRRNLCVKGHFLGIKPLKMLNGRLLWPDVYPDQIGNRG